MITNNEKLTLAGILAGDRSFVGPEHVVIDLTNRCNNNCIGCWTGSPLLRDLEPDEHWKRQELKRDAAKKLIDELVEMGVQRIRFTGGGEPFMHPDIFDFISQVKRNGVTCAITTNFTLIDEERIEKIVNLGVDEIAVSLWAATPSTYSRLHPNKTESTFLRIEKNLRFLNLTKNEHTKVTICNVIFNMNFHEAELMLDFAIDVGADGIYYTVLDPIPGRTDRLLLSPDQSYQVYQAMKKVREKANNLKKNSYFNLDNFEGFLKRIESNDPEYGNYDLTTIDEIPCYVGWIFCRILPNGDISPCCRGMNFPMDNLNKNGFKEIWYSPRYNEFRSKAKNLSKRDPYFAKIECYKTCDNMMHNKEMHEYITSLTEDEKNKVLKAVNNI